MKLKTTSSSEMDSKIEIKEENLHSDDVASENDRQFFTKNVSMNSTSGAVLLNNDCYMTVETEIKPETPISNLGSKNENVTIITNQDAVLLDNGCNVSVKTEIKSETSFLNFSSQIERECHIKCSVEQFESKTVAGIYIKTENLEQTDFGSQDKREFLPQFPVMRVKKYYSDNETEEPWWLETETSTFCDNIKDEDFPPVKSQRFCLEAVSGDSSGRSPLPSDEHTRRETGFNDGKDLPECESQESDTTRIGTVEELVHSEHSSGTWNEWGNISNGQFIILSDLKRHKNQYRCETCGRNFTQLSKFKKHNLIHEGKMPYKCDICDKGFTQLSNLKSHTLIHEGKKPFKCEICGKSFTQFSNLKRHNLVHEGTKPHKCEVCNQAFSRLYHLKRHKSIHEDKESHRCEICDESFTRIRDLKGHYLVHEGKKPHKCKICNKRFTCLSDLNIHNLIHEGKKPHKCEICDKSFTRLSDLKAHNLIHEGKKPHKCEICDRSFSRLSHLKSHNLTRKHYTAIQV